MIGVEILALEEAEAKAVEMWNTRTPKERGGGEVKIALIVMWLITGLMNLIFVQDIPKLSYGFLWIVLIIQLIGNLAE